MWDAEVSDNDALYDTELDKVRQKLQRAYMRRDHYAQLYYRAMAELDETKWELSVAKNKIQELKSLGQLFVHLCGSINLYFFRSRHARGYCMQSSLLPSMHSLSFWAMVLLGVFILHASILTSYCCMWHSVEA